MSHRPAIGAVDEQQRRHLRERLDHQDARHQRRARKMSLEELLADADVLERDEALARLVLSDRVDECRRIPVAEAIESLGNWWKQRGLCSRSGFQVQGSLL
jgi:hypothetical protein